MCISFCYHKKYDWELLCRLLLFTEYENLVIHIYINNSEQKISFFIYLIIIFLYFLLGVSPSRIPDLFYLKKMKKSS